MVIAKLCLKLYMFTSLIAPAGISPRRQKSWGGTLVTRAYIKESTLQLKYTVSMPEKISIYLNRGCKESVDNDDISIVRARKLLTRWLGWCKNRKSWRDRLGRFCDIYYTVVLRYSFALGVMWSSCFESYGPKDTR